MDVRSPLARYVCARVPVLRDVPLRLRRDAETQRRDVGAVEPARWAPVHVRARPPAARGAPPRRHVVEAGRARRARAPADPVAADAARIGPCGGRALADARVHAARLPLQRQAQARATRGRAADRRPDARAPAPIAAARALGGDPRPARTARDRARAPAGSGALPRLTLRVAASRNRPSPVRGSAGFPLHAVPLGADTTWVNE